MFDEDNNKKGADNGQKKPPGGGFKISSMTLLAWAAIITRHRGAVHDEAALHDPGDAS